MELDKFMIKELLIENDNLETEIGKLREQIPKWIPVSERLPEKDEEVWITDVEGKVERAQFYKEPYPEDGEKDMFACRTYLVYAENVLAWQSVLKPEPYKEGE